MGSVIEQALFLAEVGQGSRPRIKRIQVMAKKKWHVLLAAEVILAGGTLGEAAAQEVAAPAACTSCSRPPFLVWNRCKGRLEKWLGHDGPDTTPLGQSVYQTMTNQIDAGVAARMILNDFDFEPNSANLNFRGREKLPQLAALALRYPYFITVERTNYDPALADWRRQAVVKELARLPIPIAADRVVVGTPLTPGLSGVEAQLLYQSLLNQTRSGGTNLGTGQTGSTPSGSTTDGTTGSGQTGIPR
jgi:hypothetical protein